MKPMVFNYLFRIICDKCGLSSQARCKTVKNSSTYNFCSQNCLNSFQTGKRQKKKSKSKNGSYEKKFLTTKIIHYIFK